jgi:DinB superfamily
MGVERMDHDHTLLSFQGMADWIERLREVEDEIWLKPTATDKWSISEILSHLMFWDRYLITEILPLIEKGAEVSFPPFDSFNQKAADYARSGLSKGELIQEVVETRDQLVFELLEMPADLRVKHVQVNGVTHCPRTAEPYSLFYLVHEFHEHDQHHKTQIERFLKELRQPS